MLPILPSPAIEDAVDPPEGLFAGAAEAPDFSLVGGALAIATDVWPVLSPLDTGMATLGEKKLLTHCRGRVSFAVGDAAVDGVFVFGARRER